MSSAHRWLPMLSLVGLACTASGQNIFTIAGVPYGHRKAVDGQPALQAPLNFVYGLLFDHVTGRLLFQDQTLVERMESDGSLLALVGRGEPQDATTADGTLASNLQINILRGMAQDAAGNLYLADAGAGLVFRVAGDGRVSVFAGGGTRSGPESDGGPATAAQLWSPRGMVFDSTGNLDIAETSCDCIRQVSPAGIISTVYTQSGSPGADPRQVEGLSIDAQNNLYLTVWIGNTVLRIGADGSVTTIAGTGAAGFSGDGGPARAAQLYGPSAVAIASDGTAHIQVPRGIENGQCSLRDGTPSEPRRNSEPGCGKWTAVHRRTGEHAVRFRRHARFRRSVVRGSVHNDRQRWRHVSPLRIADIAG